jgi:hypothetical protein
MWHLLPAECMVMTIRTSQMCCRIADEADARERSSWASDEDDYVNDDRSDLFYPGNAIDDLRNIGWLQRRQHAYVCSVVVTSA